VVHLAGNTPLDQAKAWLRSQLQRGAACPCCGQFAKVYKRKLNSGMVRSLLAMYRVGGRDWIHLPTQIGARSREEGKLRYWGLVEEQLTVRPDGGRAGFWRVTAAGEAFIREQFKVPKYAQVYDGRCLGLTGDLVGIRETLGSKFRLDELLGAR